MEMLDRLRLGLPTVNVSAFDVPPPGAGFTTVTGNAPATASWVAVSAAVSDVPEP